MIVERCTGLQVSDGERYGIRWTRAPFGNRAYRQCGVDTKRAQEQPSLPSRKLIAGEIGNGRPDLLRRAHLLGFESAKGGTVGSSVEPILRRWRLA
ncbi:MAG: hypothetical protein HYX75_18875 [Acidobacteria bacterium]|nr:hypothetical protein [Acidobacteriota bacterium]